jgi:hypothetical protein
MVFWFKIDFSVILTKNCIFENKTFSLFFIISQVIHLIPKCNSRIGISPHGDALLKKLKIWLNACNILLLLLYLNGVIFSVNLKFKGKILA